MAEVINMIDHRRDYGGRKNWVKYSAVDVEEMRVDGVKVKMPVLSWEYTTTGGNATESATITWVKVGDLVIATLKDSWTNVVTLLTATENTADTVDLTFSADPWSDAIVSYVIFR